MTAPAELAQVVKHVQRVKDLVRLAVDPAAADNEARSAALTACRLVATHGLIITSPLLTAPTCAEPPRPWASTNAAPGNWSSSSSTGSSSSYSRGPSASRGDERPRTIRVRFDSVCRVCGIGIPIGSLAQWTRGRGVAHVHCAQGERV
jgi:hypothetical protein